MAAHRGATMTEKPVETKGSKVPDHVPRYEHECPTHGWETCGIAASLVDPHSLKAEHGCARTADPPVIFVGQVREVP